MQLFVCGCVLCGAIVPAGLSNWPPLISRMFDVPGAPRPVSRLENVIRQREEKIRGPKIFLFSSFLFSPSRQQVIIIIVRSADISSIHVFILLDNQAAAGNIHRAAAAAADPSFKV